MSSKQNAKGLADYPLKFMPVTPTKDVAERSASFVTSQAFPSMPNLQFHSVSKAGQECKEFRLAEIGGWPETKAVMQLACTDLPFGLGRACTDLPRIYTRKCTKYIYLNVCYPTGVLGDVEECVKGAALAGAVAAVIASPAAAAPAFEAALKGCLAAKGAAWKDQVSVSAGWNSTCGDWSPV